MCWKCWIREVVTVLLCLKRKQDEGEEKRVRGGREKARGEWESMRAHKRHICGSEAEDSVKRVGTVAKKW